MSKRSDLERLQFVVEMIETIEIISKRHKRVKNALSDIEGQNAIFMCLIQIGEKLNKIETPDIRKELPVKEASSVRNFIVHDYTGVNLEIIEEVITSDIKLLEKTIRKILR
ncbi:MAG TPA: DUF86 domain-containing protein [bacterium]|nr:DUF86 domain-containing protein [bacterium]